MQFHENIMICPICQNELKPDLLAKVCRCTGGHSFDIARQGYVNLLTSNQKNSKAPGDSAEMVQARRAFLGKGYYRQLSDCINQRVESHLDQPGHEAGTVLDIGCGEGYYLSRLRTSLATSGIQADLYGLDISKDAVKAAGGAVKDCTWLVGNSHRIPLKSRSLDAVLSVFSPIASDEVVRLLKPDGIFIRVLPGPDHLLQMRQLIYPEVIRNPERELVENYPGLEFMEALPVVYDIVLNTAELGELVRMTPHFWKTTKADKEALNVVDSLTVTIDMRILVYELM